MEDIQVPLGNIGLKMELLQEIFIILQINGVNLIKFLLVIIMLLEV